jgi:hypothetical protein
VDQQQLLLVALIAAAAVGLLAVVVHVARERGEREEAERDSPIAMSSEGVKLCPHCAADNLWTDTRCIGCGRPLPDAQRRAW